MVAVWSRALSQIQGERMPQVRGLNPRSRTLTSPNYEKCNDQ